MNSEKKETYNGWSNYATWRVNLEFIEGTDWQDDGGRYKDIGEIADGIKERLEEYMDECKSDNLFYDGWANAFVSEVNFYQIAKHVSETYPEILIKA